MVTPYGTMVAATGKRKVWLVPVDGGTEMEDGKDF